MRLICVSRAIIARSCGIWNRSVQTANRQRGCPVSASDLLTLSKIEKQGGIVPFRTPGAIAATVSRCSRVSGEEPYRQTQLVRGTTATPSYKVAWPSQKPFPIRERAFVTLRAGRRGQPGGVRVHPDSLSPWIGRSALSTSLRGVRRLGRLALPGLPGGDPLLQPPCAATAGAPLLCRDSAGVAARPQCTGKHSLRCPHHPPCARRPRLKYEGLRALAPTLAISWNDAGRNNTWRRVHHCVAAAPGSPAAAGLQPVPAAGP
jgi:hypothetical protein